MRPPAWLGRLLLFVSLLLAHIQCEDVFGIVGENFTFPVKIYQKKVEIIWTKNKDKVAEWDGQNKPTYFTSLRDRGLLNEENGCLTIFNLEYNDTGTYVLEYLDSMQNDLTFILSVLAPPSEPEISCNVSGDNLVLKCAADFEKPLNYAWKFSSIQVTYQTQEVFIRKNDVDASEKAECFIKFSQMEKSSEISLARCFPDKKGDSYQKRSRDGLIAAFIFVSIVGIGIVGFLYRRGRPKLLAGGAAQKNSPVHGSGEDELFYSKDSQEQPNSDRDKDLNKEDSALKDKQTVKNGVSQEETAPDPEKSEEELSTNQNSTLTSECAIDHGVTEGEVTQGAEGGKEEQLSNSPSCSKEDLESKANNCFVDQTTMEEKW